MDYIPNSEFSEGKKMMYGNHLPNEVKFENQFPYDKEQYFTVVLFFDNLIRRNFLVILNRIRNIQDSMLCDNIGYNLPENEDDDCEWKKCGCIELWWVAGTNGHSFNINFRMFIECLRLSAKIWIKNNGITDIQIVSDIEKSIDEIELRYTNYYSDLS